MGKQSAWPWMGSYVVPKNLRQRGPHAGTWRIQFHVPKRLRPPGWPPVVELPRAKPYCKGPDDLESIIRIKEDATALYEALRAGRHVGDDTPPAVRVGSVPWLIEKWGGKKLLDAVEGTISTKEGSKRPDPSSREEWRNAEPGTRRLYIRSVRHVLAWSISIRHAPVSSMKPKQVSEFLDLWKDAPGQRKNIRDALSQLFGIAGEEDELETNPLTGLKAKVKRKNRKRVKGGRRTKVARWLRCEVETYSDTARTVAAWQSMTGKRVKTVWKGGSILVRLMYETARTPPT